MVVARRRQSRARSLLIVMVLLSLTLIAVDQSGDVSHTHPIRSHVQDSFVSIGNEFSKLWPFGNSKEIKSLQAQNAQLKSQLEQANGQSSQSADTQRELDQLNSLLALPTVNNASKVIARVVNIGSSNFDATVQLNKGSNDGIKAGMPVVTGAGLVGRVIQTSNNRSTVLLITDTTANVSIRYSTTGDVAVAAGQGLGKSMRGDLVNLDSAIQPGDVAVTSGLDGSLYPPGIPVAKVASSSSGPQDLRRNIVLQPVVDFNKLDDVAVVQWNA